MILDVQTAETRPGRHQRKHGRGMQGELHGLQGPDAGLGRSVERWNQIDPNRKHMEQHLPGGMENVDFELTSSVPSSFTLASVLTARNSWQKSPD